jgi:hypothetical protein
MSALAATVVLLSLGALPAPRAVPEPTPPPDAPSRAADRPAGVGGRHLLPEAFEVPYSGGLVPFGARVVSRTNERQLAVGQALLFTGLGIQWLASIVTAAYGFTLLFSSVPFDDVAGIMLMFFAVPMSVPFVAPILGVYFLAAAGQTLLALAVAAVAGLQVGGAICWATAKYEVLRFEPPVQPPRPVESVSITQSAPVDGPRLSFAF